MSSEWDPRKAEANFKKHEVRFTEAEPVFGDDLAVTNTDDESDPHELRYVSIGTGMKGRVLWWFTAIAAERFASSPHARQRRMSAGNTRSKDEG